jgi:hypothetical protein
MKAFARVWIGIACAMLLSAQTAEAAHKLTVKKAEAALKPGADQMTPLVAQKVASVLPAATISKTRITCELTKRKQSADCNIEFAIAGAFTGETACALPARVRFRSKTSSKLKVSIAPALGCIFVVPLE